MDNDKTMELPNSWTSIIFSDAVINISTTGKKIPQKDYLDSGSYPIIDQGQEYVGGYTESKEILIECELPIIIFGDHTRIVKYVNQPFAVGADGVKVLQPQKFYNPKLLEYFTTRIISNLTNYGYARHYQHLAKSTIPLPPLPEQQRIVAKIEALFSELDKGIESLKTAQQQLKIYRQALLKHAFSGKLTEQWRAENQDKLETAEALLQRIQIEREQRYQDQLKEWETNGKQGTKPKAPKVLPPLTDEELAELPELPAGWGWVKVDKYADITANSIKAGPFGSSLKKEFYVKDGYKIYGQEQVISGEWNKGDYFIDESKYIELQSCKVQAFDILISLVGTIGKVLILPENFTHGVINPRLVKISPDLNTIFPEFFKYYFESAFLKSLYKLETHGATMDVLNLGIIQSLPFPICSLKEQAVLIQELESRFSITDQLEQTITTALQQSEVLRQSILKKAFSGQLVPQDPNDEPASVLLERIKAEKAALINLIKKGKNHA